MQNKIKLTFSRFFDNCLSKYLFLKKVYWIGVKSSLDYLSYLPKLRKGSRHSFCCAFAGYFLTEFQYKNFSPSLDVKQYVFLNFCLAIDAVINFKIYVRSFSRAMADRGKKKGRGNTKI